VSAHTYTSCTAHLAAPAAFCCCRARTRTLSPLRRAHLLNAGTFNPLPVVAALAWQPPLPLPARQAPHAACSLPRCKLWAWTRRRAGGGRIGALVRRWRRDDGCGAERAAGDWRPCCEWPAAPGSCVLPDMARACCQQLTSSLRRYYHTHTSHTHTTHPAGETPRSCCPLSHFFVNGVAAAALCDFLAVSVNITTHKR